MSRLNELKIKVDNFEEMTEKEWFEFRNLLDPDSLGFDDHEEYFLEDLSKNEIVYGSSKNINNSFEIKDNFTTRNYSDSNLSRIKYIVIHYTANNGDTAWANTNYFKSEYRGASAHYFVDENPIIWRCVKDEDISWHCGGGLQGPNGHSFYQKCTNSNSIGIEMCSRKYSNGTYYFKEQTVINCANLVKYLMNKYNIPSENVIRHYDVTGKICPAPFVNDVSAWNNFKNSLNRFVSNKPGIYKVVDCDELNVRTGNSISYSKIGTLKVNTEIEVTEFNNGWGKINYNNTEAWISLTYLIFISEIKVHWAQTYLDTLKCKGVIENEDQWKDFDKPVTKALTVALIDKITGGIWGSNEANSKIHWAQPHVISLGGKKIITDKIQWIPSLNENISKALLLALVCNIGGGLSNSYTNRLSDHWARNCLDTLCDRGIIDTPSSWVDFDVEVSKGLIMALLCKAIYK